VNPGREQLAAPPASRSRRPHLVHQPHSVISITEIPRHIYSSHTTPKASDEVDATNTEKEQPTVTISTEINGRTVAQVSVPVPPRPAYISSACSELASAAPAADGRFSFNDLPSRPASTQPVPAQPNQTIGVIRPRSPEEKKIPPPKPPGSPVT